MKLSTKLIILFLVIISLSLALVAWQGLKHFIKDKETYVHDINAQNLVVLSNFLANRVKSVSEKLNAFYEFSGYSFSNAEAKARAQTAFQNKYLEFFSIAVFEVEGDRVFQKMAFYNEEALGAAKTGRKELSSDKFVAGIHRRAVTGVLEFANITKNTSLPLMAAYKKISPKVTVIASLPQNSMMNIVSSKTVYTAFVVDSRGNLIMDQNPLNLVPLKNMSGHPMAAKIIADVQRRISGGTGEYVDESSKEEMLGSWAHVGDTGLGLVVEMPKRLAYMAAEELLRKLAFWIILIFVTAVLVTMFFSSTITKPLAKLTQFAAKVGKGEFDAELPKKTNDELGALVGAFNAMNAGLKERDKKIEETHKQLVQSEKMGAFGQMSAGIAHEVKNPLAGILGYAQIARKKAPPESGLDNYLGIIEKETKRCKEIVENLMRFARAEKAAFEDTDLVKVVRDSVALVDHQISISGIKIVRVFPEEGVAAVINGNANQITQVLTNIMLNAQYAMKKKGEGGTLTVEVIPKENSNAKIIISDTGTGIKEENIPKLFDPFFTTKPAGEGTGLGLSVTYGIIKDHKGEVRVESKYGEWAKFIITLPLKA